jgi:hypothetical protein
VDTHILEEVSEGPEYKIDTSFHEEFPDLEKGMLYRQLATLHKFGKLDKPHITLSDVPKLYTKGDYESLDIPATNLNTFEMDNIEANNSDKEMMNNMPIPPRKSRYLYGLSEDNILTEKRVRFNVSKILTGSEDLEYMYPNNTYFGYQIVH